MAEAHVNLAWLPERSARLPEAQSHYRRALALQPLNLQSRLNVGAIPPSHIWPVRWASAAGASAGIQDGLAPATETGDWPWYPGVMRLFRQRRMGDWTSTMEEVRQALSAFVRNSD
jgi:hypothetical protein